MHLRAAPMAAAPTVPAGIQDPPLAGPVGSPSLTKQSIGVGLIVPSLDAGTSAGATQGWARADAPVGGMRELIGTQMLSKSSRT